MINLYLEIAEVEAALKHISQQAYADVAPLIAKIHGQAAPQVAQIQASNPPVVEKQQEDKETIVEPDTSLS
jgi:hypothetical protein